MTDEPPDFRKFKPKKPKITVPAEFLDNAKSYEDKLTLVKILSEKEKQRVVLLFKKMIQSGMDQDRTRRGLR
jgi:hypothetical protein